MNSSEDPGDSVTQDGAARALSWVPSSNASTIMALGCSLAALIIAFIGLAQFDLSIVRYVRSVTIHLPWNQLTIPWMAFTSDTGNWIGEGTHLIAMSVVFWAVGWVFSRPAMRVAGTETVLAHGIAALLTNGLKHLIGRPRPKFVHSGEWQFAPSWTSGLDSFPSGHTSVSFAVATVLAKRFPTFAPLCVSVAAFVALSRVLRGSHFPTDVVGGAVVGVLSGSISVAPLKEWNTSLQDGLRHSAIGACAMLALLWTLSHQVEEGMTSAFFMGLGAVATVSGLWLRRTSWFRKEQLAQSWQANASLALMAYGLAALTTSPLVLASAGFACLAFWLPATITPEQQKQDSPAWAMVRESALIGGVLLALLILYDGRGVLPFQ